MYHRRTLTLTTPESVRDATIGAMTIGLVPIMGAIHEGHLSLIRRAHLENDETVVAIFDPSGEVPMVTPHDIVAVREAGARIFYRPEPETIFPAGFRTSVRVPELASRWEGDARKGHFDRVTAFFVILLNHLQPTRTYIGEKHLQQLRILQRVHADLGLSGEIVPCVTVRDPDGLPLSSYNGSLSDEERAAALAIPQALFAMQQATIRGERNVAELIAIGREKLDAQPLLQLDYLDIVHPAMFTVAGEVTGDEYAIVAGALGETRLLDSLQLNPGGTHS